MNITLGGIQHKIFNLVLIPILAVMAAYTVVVIHQVGSLGDLVTGTNEQQKQSISTLSSETMDSVISTSLTQSTTMEARIADDMFSDTANAVKMLADYATIVFSNPESYPEHPVATPDASLDGVSSVQLLGEAGVDYTDATVSARVGLAGNLSDMMVSLYDNVELDSIYVALPEGAMVLVDDHASSKFAEDGSVTSIAIHERDWYTGAIEAGGLYFTDVSRDVFTGQVAIMCSMPVYVDGQVAAVVGADLFLDNMATYVNSSDAGSGFVCIVNEQGHVVFSPETSGAFAVSQEGEATDLRETGNDELTAFVNQALTETTPVTLVSVGRTAYYLVGSPVPTVGWTVVSAVSKEITDLPTVQLEQAYDDILGQASESFTEEIGHARMTITVLLVIITAVAIAGALFVSRRIVSPLEAITKRVGSLGGDDLQFMMEDEYRTGDEIEVLAESFATLSARTLQYVDQVRNVTAEKERMSAELNMATDIQASQLPRLFPAFPNRIEFDIFASMDPAKEVGGDFYDFFMVDDDHIGLVMADVSGKGIPAALFMMVSRVLIKSHMQNGETPGEALESVNNQLCESNEAELFVTVWAAVVELSTGKGIAANAGHEHPALRRKDGSFELVVYRHSPAVGLMEGMFYREHDFQLRPGDSLFVYTDGVAEATNANDELFGTDRMLEALNANPDARPTQVLEEVRSSVDNFVGDAEQFDDLTMLCLTYFGPNGREGLEK